MEKLYKVRVAVTHKFTEETLRGLWQYHKREPFNLRKAMQLARVLLSDNPEMDTQINEGLEQLGKR